MKTEQSFLDNDELLTVDELSTALKVTPGWIYQRIHAGTLPFKHVKVGHFPRFPKSEVERFLARQLKEQSA